MSDPTAIRAGLKAGLVADAGVIAAFGANAVRIFDMPPTNVHMPYIIVSIVETPDEADCVEGSGWDITLDIWSRTEPPSFDEAGAIVGACQTFLRANSFTITGHVLAGEYELLGVDYVNDPSDNATAHAPLRCRLFTEPNP